MFKVKQKIATLLAAFLTAIFAIVLAFGTMTATPKTTAKAADVTDVLTLNWTGVSVGTSYATWTGKKGSNSEAVYAGNNAGDSGTIQLRSSNSNSGIVITASGGLAVEVSVVWGTKKTSTTGRTVDVYGKNTAYSQASDLYNSTNQGTKIGSIVCGTSTTLTIKGDYAFIGLRSKSGALYLDSISIKWEVSSGCTHENKTYVEAVAATCTEAGKIAYYACPDCETNFSDEACTQPVEDLVDPNAPAKGHTKGELSYTDNKNGTHAVKSVCTVEGCNTEFTVDEAEQCNVEAAYEREGDMHTQTGTCTLCGASTSVTEGCTIDNSKTTYAQCATDNQAEQKHNVTTYCEVCEQDNTVEEACLFDDGVLDGTTLTFTCEHCAYSYSQEATTHTVTYSVPNGIDTIPSVDVAENYATTLPTANTIEGYTFIGWTTASYEANSVKPETFDAGSEYTVTEDVTLYALYSYTEESDAWSLVTDAANLVAGDEIVIAASGSDYALSTTQNNNNRGKAAIEKNGATITFGDDVQIITLGKDGSIFTLGVSVNNNLEYLYAAGSSSGNYLKTAASPADNRGDWSIVINADGVATIISQTSKTSRKILRYNSSDNLFSCYSTGQNDVSIYKQGGFTYYYTTEFAECPHTDMEDVTTPATCTEDGKVVSVCSCGYTVEKEVIPALGHNYVDGVCTRCEEVDPNKMDYSGYYYFAAKRSAGNYFYFGNAWDNSKGRYVATDSGLTVLPTSIVNMELTYVFRVVKNESGLYTIYEGMGDTIFGGGVNNVTIVKNDNGTFSILDNETYFQFNNKTGDNYVKWYPSEQVKEISFVPVALASFDEASVTVGTDIKVNYYVTIPEAIAESVVFNYKIGDSADIYEAKGVLVGEQYKFSLAIGPHLMTETLTAWISLDSTTLALHNTLSIRSYAQELLKNAEYTTELKQLVSDMLRYGAAAQKYQSHKVDDLATAVDGILTASAATPTEGYSLVKNPDATEFPVFFKGASVWFGDMNRIRVSFKLADRVAFEDLENVTLTIGENTVVLTSIDYTYVTEGILATELDKEFTFVLSCNGVELQTLTYSVAAYAKQMQSNPNMSELALALYRYGESAKNYQTSLIA